jgi:chromate reductase
MKVLAVAGSLRAGSFNKAALREAVKLAPKDMEIEVFDIADFPLYNEDVRQKGFPPSVERFREKIRAADALLFVTPEYNFSVPGMLKNALDWVSRPPDMPLIGKPATVMGASPGLMGTVRAQLHLRQILSGLNMPLLNRPEVLIREARSKFDAAGLLTDEDTRKRIRTLLERLLDWTRLIKGSRR